MVICGLTELELLSKKVYVEKVYTVTEQQIRDAMQLVIEKTKMLIEPSSAVPLAVVL